MNRLKQITTKAKSLYKTGKFAKWTDAIKQASKSLGATKKEIFNPYMPDVDYSERIKKLVKKVKTKLATKSHKPTKYINEYIVQGNYGNGYEDLTSHNTMKIAIAEKKVYDLNERYAHRVITRKVKNDKYLGAVKIIQKGETPKSKVTKVLQQIRTKKGTFKGYKQIGSVKSDNAKQLILNNISTEGYGEKATTPEQKIRFIEKTFLSEYGWAVARMGKQRAIEEWLRGLPSALTLPFANVDILNLAIQWGALKPNATEKMEDKILANYWKLMASQLLQMISKRKLNKKFY